MRYTRSLVSFTLFLVLALLIFWMMRPPATQTLGESCLHLYRSIAQSPGIDAGQADYETYAGLKTPPLHPDEALALFNLEEGFRIEIVAHEPMVVDPVAMDIDADGRLWVVDMPSYMPVHDLDEWETVALEQVPKGRVVVLEDTTGDGVMDTKRIFIEELVLPRSIKVLADGILVAEPPNVWHIRDTTGDGKGDSRQGVYAGYGDPTTDNVEHMPNGLMWGMDNWLHSSHSNVESLRRIDGYWQTRPMQQLGQWGISQDDYGRLYSSHNTNPLQTHFIPPGYGSRNPLLEARSGTNVNIAPVEPMWPAHVAGVNRGYRIGNEVREDGTLLRATSTTGAVIYRGSQFGKSYRGNAFVPEPAANLIKYYLVDADPAGLEAVATDAYDEREFLTSTDERFRPVNMYNAPDGSLYIVDMYRGLFQHARYLTEHLREYTVENDLYKPYGMFGRIYRVVRDDRPIDYHAPRLSEKTAAEVAGYLQHENGALRDQAQQLLVQCAPAEVIPALESLALDRSVEPYVRLHALWTLEGFNSQVYDPEHLTALSIQVLDDDHPRVRASALRILEPAISSALSGGLLDRLEEMAEKDPAPYVQLQLLGSLGESDETRALELMASLLDRNRESVYFREMALSGAYTREAEMANLLRDRYGWDKKLGDETRHLLEILAEAGTDQTETAPDHLTDAQRNLYESGHLLYRTCTVCHGDDGQGLEGTGSALAGSNWVNEDPGLLTRIILQGFEDGAAERGEDLQSVMPAHQFMSDEDIAAIVTYIRLSWGNEASPVTPDQVKQIREETADRRNSWTPDELRQLQE